MITRSRRLGLLAACVVSATLLLVGPGLADPPSDAERGRAIFTEKQCTRCHQPGGGSGVGPGLEELRRPQGSLELVGRLWNHVPAMWATLAQEGMRWPDISAEEMGHLMAYLKADGSRDPAPDPRKGQVIVMRKGCLKCHSLRRQGGATQPDLAAWRPEWGSASTWAATMWTHTPRMLRAISSQHVAYPRFSGDEMSNLLGFLRQAGAGPSPTPGR